jgi:hypothetical protein
MADTVRTLAALQTLLADNATGEISPQDLRDMLVSLASTQLAMYDKGWKDNVSLISAAPGGAAAPSLTNFQAAGSLQRQEYAFALNDYVFLGAFHINHDISSGCKAYLHCHWAVSGTNVNTVKWEFHVQRALGHSQAAFPVPAAVSVTKAPTGTAYTHMISEVAIGDAMTLTEPDELILVSLKRVTNGGTDNTDSVFGLLVDLHYEADRMATLNKSPNFYA